MIAFVLIIMYINGFDVLRAIVGEIYEDASKHTKSRLHTQALEAY